MDNVPCDTSTSCGTLIVGARMIVTCRGSMCDSVLCETNASCNALTVDDKNAFCYALTVGNKKTTITVRGRKRKSRTVYVSYITDEFQDVRAAAAAAALRRTRKRSVRSRWTIVPPLPRRPLKRRRQVTDYFDTEAALCCTGIPEVSSPGSLGDRVGIGTVVF